MGLPADGHVHSQWSWDDRILLTGGFDRVLGSVAFEPELREALAAVHRSGRILEVNTGRVFHAEVLDWWRAAGGRAVTFGSDAHDPDALAHQFRAAADAAAAHGFRAGPDPVGPWTRE